MLVDAVEQFNPNLAKPKGLCLKSKKDARGCL